MPVPSRPPRNPSRGGPGVPFLPDAGIQGGLRSLTKTDLESEERDHVMALFVFRSLVTGLQRIWRGKGFSGRPRGGMGEQGSARGFTPPTGVLAQTLEFMPLDGEPSTCVKESGLAVLVTMDQRNRGILEEFVVTLNLSGRGQRAHLRGRCEPNRGPGTPPQGCPTHPECCPC